VNPLNILEPKSLGEALSLLATSDPAVRPIAGGTALMLMMKSKLFQPETLVSLNRVQNELNEISRTDDGGLRIGALASLRDLELSSVVRDYSPVLTTALRTLSNVRVRNVATLGGHLAHADPHMDLPPILMGLDARVKVDHHKGSRWLTLEELITGYYSTSLQSGELITEIVVPPLPAGTAGTYIKYTSISADDWPTVGLCVFLRRDRDKLANVKISVSAATEKSIRLRDVEAFCDGELPTDALMNKAADMTAAGIHPLADIRGSAPYKREMVRVCTKRALASALQSTSNQGGK